MLVSTDALVLRHTKYSDSSIIAAMLTRELGIQTYIVSGVHSPKAPIKPSLLQPGMLLEVVAYSKAGRDIHRLKEARVKFPYVRLPIDPSRAAIALFICELVIITVREEEPQPSIFDFTSDFLQAVDADPGSAALYPLFYFAALAEHLGIRPIINHSETDRYFSLSAGSFTAHRNVEAGTIGEELSRSIAWLWRLESPSAPTHIPDSEIRTELFKALDSYYRFHIPSYRTPKSLEVLRGMMDDLRG